MRAFFLFALAMAVCSCGDKTCSDSDLTGSYLLTFSETSGDCGALASQVIAFSNGQALGASDPDCTDNYDRMSEDNCQNESQTTCLDSADNATIVMTGVMTQKTDDGSEYKGTMSLVITSNANGSTLCVSSYAMTAKRQ